MRSNTQAKPLNFFQFISVYQPFNKDWIAPWDFETFNFYHAAEQSQEAFQEIYAKRCTGKTSFIIAYAFFKALKNPKIRIQINIPIHREDTRVFSITDRLAIKLPIAPRGRGRSYNFVNGSVIDITSSQSHIRGQARYDITLIDDADHIASMSSVISLLVSRSRRTIAFKNK